MIDFLKNLVKPDVQPLNYIKIHKSHILHNLGVLQSWQKDAEIWEITVGDLLRKVASENPNTIALIDILENGDCGQSWTYSELFAQGERLAQSLATRF